MLSNRTVIGIICIVAAAAICFGVAPLVNKASEGTARIVRITHTIPQGGMITEDAIELVDVGSFNLPREVLRKRRTSSANTPRSISMPETTCYPER